MQKVQKVQTIMLGLLVVVTAAAYTPAWHGEPVWDDAGHLTRPDLQGIDGLRRIWVSPGATQQYYPVVHTAFWVQYQLWGDAPLGYHLVNITLHALSAWLVGLLLVRLAVPGAWLAAAIFALHPVHVESVAWMSELKNVLSGVFFLLALHGYLRFDSSRRPQVYVLTSLTFTLALLSKSVTATLPVCVAILLWWQRGSLTWTRDVRPLVPLTLLASAAAAMTVWFERVGIGAIGDDFGFSLVERTLIAGRAVWFYAGSLAWPTNLMFNYPRWTINSGDPVAWLYPAGVALALGLLWWGRDRWGRGPLTAALLFVVILGPALGFVNAYPFRFSFVADHFQYLASLALIVPAAAVIAHTWHRRPLWLATVLICAPLTWLTWQQSAHYESEERLYRATLERNPESWLAHTNLSALLAQQSGTAAHAEALRHATSALRLKPDSPVVQYNVGMALELTGQPAQAASHYRSAVAGFGAVPSEARSVRLGQLQHRLGVVLSATGRLDEAVTALEGALHHRGDDPDVHTDLAMVLAQQRDFDGAIRHFTTAATLRPDAGAFNNLGGVALQARQFDEAVGWLERATAMAPDLADAFYNLGVALTSLERWRDAALAYQRVLQLEGPTPDLLARLGLLWFEAGERDAAVGVLREALRIDPTHRMAQTVLRQIEPGDSL